MCYESPINIIYGEINTKMENEVLTVIQNLGVDVNKEELIRALQYDREQYQKGYDDRDKEIVRCKDCEYGELCNEGDVFCTKDIGTIESSIHKSEWFCADGTSRS